MNDKLSNKKCIPCQGGVPALSEVEVNDLLHSLLDEKSEDQSLLNQWKLNDAQHLMKSYEFNNFVEAMEFANKVTIIAEQEQHHPDLTIAWGKCSVEIWTHKINGLTESDFILAAKIDKI